MSHGSQDLDRRDFLKYASLAALAAGSGLPGAAQASRSGPTRQPGPERLGAYNTMPGRIVLAHDENMGGTSGTLDRDLIEQTVHACVRMLTGQPDTGLAFESLFPGLHSGSTFAIKINCLGPCDTKWETARGVVSGLSRMLGGTYDVSQVTVFDRHNLTYHDYTPGEFTFGGNTAVISSTNAAQGSGYWIYDDHQLSQYILDCDYLINMPVLKHHGAAGNLLTLALKNHYGSCWLSNLCSDVTGMLAVNADGYIKDKTALVLMDGIQATFSVGPSSPPQPYITFGGGAPNMLFATTDPITNDYWGRDYINAERLARGLSPRGCEWIETGAAEPYDLGIADEAQMEVLHYDVTAVEPDPALQAGGLFLAPARPNPASAHAALRFRLPRGGAVQLAIVDASGRIIRRLTDRFAEAGYTDLLWDGRDDGGARVPAGVYYARLQSGRQTRTRKIVLAR